MKKSVLLSSLIFGLGHLINLVGYSTPIRTMTQVIYTFLNGILFASIYLRCKNIWGVAIIHALLDWLVMVPGIFHQMPAQTAQADSSIGSMLITSILYIPFVLLGFFYLRKVNPQDMLQSIANTKTV